MAPSVMNCMRDQPHEADGTAPVDQVYAPLHLASANKQKFEQFTHRFNKQPTARRNAERKKKKPKGHIFATEFGLIFFGAPGKQKMIVRLGRPFQLLDHPPRTATQPRAAPLGRLPRDGEQPSQGSPAARGPVRAW
jgi:hypothetical protein